MVIKIIAVEERVAANSINSMGIVIRSIVVEIRTGILFYKTRIVVFSHDDSFITVIIRSNSCFG